MLGLGLRFYRLSNQSLWTDEVSSLMVAQGPLNRIVSDSALNNSFPTFFLILRAVVGDAHENVEVRARALSALAGALSVPVLIAVVYLWRRKRGPALVAGLLLAINPLHLWYSQEVRAYSLMLFFGLLSILFYEMARATSSTADRDEGDLPEPSKWAALLTESPRRTAAWAGYLMSSLMAIALHKTALVFPAACALWHTTDVLMSHGRIRNLLIHVAIFACAFAALALHTLHPPPPEFSRSNSLLPIAYTFMTYAGGYSFGPSLTDLQSYGARGAVSRNLLQVAILGGVFLILAAGFLLARWIGRPAAEHATEAAKPDDSVDYFFVPTSKAVTLLVLSVGTVWAGTLFSAFPFNVRYTLPGLPAFLALLAPLVTPPNRAWIGRTAIAVTLVVALWADWQWFFDPAYRKGDSRAVASWLVKNDDRVKTWTVLPDYLALSVEWYLHTHPEIQSNLVPAKQATTTSFPPVPDVLIIGRRHHVHQPEQLVGTYEAQVGRIQAIRSFAGFELYLRAPAQ